MIIKKQELLGGYYINIRQVTKKHITRLTRIIKHITFVEKMKYSYLTSKRRRIKKV